MVKVIGFDETKKSIVTCKETSRDPGCGAINEYTKSDIKRYEGKDIGGGPDGREWISCGHCGRDITLRSW